MSEWVAGKYSHERRVLAGRMVLVAWWDGTGPRNHETPPLDPYLASVGGAELTGRFASMAEAKAAAEAVARRQSERNLADLNTPPTEAQSEPSDTQEKP